MMFLDHQSAVHGFSGAVEIPCSGLTLLAAFPQDTVVDYLNLSSILLEHHSRDRYGTSLLNNSSEAHTDDAPRRRSRWVC